MNEQHFLATISLGTDDTSNIQEKLHGERINTEEPVVLVTNDHPTSHADPPLLLTPHFLMQVRLLIMVLQLIPIELSNIG